jgi:tetratricopeptide (TPR) repeat protein
MHERSSRQLFSASFIALRAVCLVACLGSRAHAVDADASTWELDRELQAASVTENTLLTKYDEEGVAGVSRANQEKIALIYQQIVAQHPKNARALNAYAEYLWKIERRPDAMVKWEEAEILDPENGAVANNLGGCHLAFGDAKKATEYFERAARLNPKTALYQFNAANTCYLFRHQIATATETAETVMNRALDHFRQAAQIEPFNVDYARAYAETFYAFEKPDWSLALHAWKHYLDITDQKDFAYLNLARVNLKMGHKGEAREDLARIQNPGFTPLKERFMRETEAK